MKTSKRMTLAIATVSAALALSACSKTADAISYPSISQVAATTITAAGSYDVTSGVTVNAPADATVVLKLKGATLTEPIVVEQAGEVVIQVEENSSITTTSVNAIDAKSNLTIEGPGTLTINSDTEDAINVDQNLTVNGTNLNITAGDKGLKANHDLTISGGAINVNNSNEALEALNITINDGVITTRSTDDGINASIDDDLADQNVTPSVNIKGGTVTVRADGDGIDSNGNLTISGGTTTVIGPTSMDNGSFDADGTFSITGGTVVGIGNGGMPQTPTVGQGWIYQNITVSNQDQVKVTDSSNGEVLSFTADQAATALFVSTPTITEGQTYTVTSGNNSATVVAGENANTGMPGMNPGLSGGSSSILPDFIGSSSRRA
ncbi:MAG: carbohydrate-binding domain-containing protein [Corynebacterium sp.]|nr:carbohydrate-binding domain-containing protein [Corynebacterium sp.]